MASFRQLFDFRFKKASLLQLSVISLVAANLFPVFGVLFLGWDAFLLLILFWMENVVIGIYTVFKMLFSSPGTKQESKAFIIPFFCVHYGIFTAGHGFFVLMLFGGGLTDESAFTSVASGWQWLIDTQLAWGALALFISHGVSFFYNYIGAGEYKQSKLADLITQPYGRVVVLHVTIIIGGFLVMALGAPVIGLIFLIALKTVLDVLSHLREHEKYRIKSRAAG
ncbi:MAG: DUF6498-containing protein [Dehalococcoidales bacterium]|nr:DUF6498-containing protein [Dehalococcoidales bacterium]